MSDIQAKLADINARAAAAQAKRDREFFALVGLHMLVIAAAGLIAFFAAMGFAARAEGQQKIADLVNQEMSHAYRP